MESLASSFVALPGGFGTLDELFEILTWAQLGIHQKPVGLLDTAGFWQPLVSLVDHMVREEFIPEGQTRLFVVDPDPESLLDKLAAWTPPLLGPKWVERGAT